MMSVKKKSRLRPIWGCLCSVAWATCSGIIRLSLKISCGFFRVVSFVPGLGRESSVLGFARAGSSHVGEEWGVLWPQLLGTRDGMLGVGRHRGDTRFAGKEGRILPPWELLQRWLGRPKTWGC